MENQFRKYMKKASAISSGDICIWKHILGEEGQVEGRLERCDKDCNGRNYNCEYYISQETVRKYGRQE